MRIAFKYFVAVIILSFANKSFAQSCALGQSAQSAFPVCGVSTFTQTEVKHCDGNPLPVPCNDGASYRDLNAFWYSFTCYTSGDFVFSLDPHEGTDDYDWQLFDVTGYDVSAVYTNSALYVASNWSANPGKTGTSKTASGFTNCAGYTYPNFSAAPKIIAGHKYLLMVSHYTDTNQSGYDLAFDPVTSVNITDPTIPAVSTVEASCDGMQLKVKLSKKMKCSSIAANGTDFKVLGPVKTTSAVGVGCSLGFETDSIVLDLNQSILPGNATLLVVKGSDGNTITDNCNVQIADSARTDFRVYERVPTPFDSLLTVGCAPNIIQLVFNKNIRCNSVAPDGSDFFITGSYPVGVIAAEGRCANDVTKVINITLNQKLAKEGTFTLNLKKGSDGNTLIDECSAETTIPQTASFFVKDTVSARYDYHITENCANDVIALVNAGGNGITQWTWTVDGNVSSAIQNPTLTYSTYGNKTIQLAVTNGFCTDTVTHTIDFPHDTLEARFNGPSLYCPNDIAIFKDSSRGNIITWNWQFGNGHTSNLQVPPAQTFYTTQVEQLFPVSLVVQNTRNCFDTSTHYVKVTKSCFIAVPSAFTPNGDGRNDYLYPLNAYKAANLIFSVYDKHGQKVYETKEWTKKWDGTFNGHPQPTDVYVWMLQYRDETGKNVFLKGTTVLIR